MSCHFHSFRYFQRVLNNRTYHELEEEAVDTLASILGDVPVIKDVELEKQVLSDDAGVDLIARFHVNGVEHALICEIKASGQPGKIRQDIYRLKYVVDRHGGPDARAMLIAPYLSPEARSLCRDLGVAYLDFEGNSRVAFDDVYIERESASRPKAAKRELKSLYKPKSLQVLRVLIRDPARAWKVADLAEAADVSLGHVSNVRTALIEREFAEADTLGLHLTRPAALLDEWRENHEPPVGQRLGFYTTMHGQAFEEAVRSLMRIVGRDALLASFSAADWLAPYVRTPSQHLYVRGPVFDRVRDHLRATTAAKGENLFLTILHDDGVLRDFTEPAEGVFTTGHAQTYVDLYQTGDRGREAAEHLRREHMPWPK